MRVELGLYGFGILLVLALVFGFVVQLLGARWRWEWLLGAAAWFLGGLFMSEVIFANATEDEIQPIVDGLAFDEALLGGLVAGIVAVMFERYLTGAFPFRSSAAR